MIFINYRQEDTKPVIPSLSQLLKERYGEENVFVDFHDIPFGSTWPSYLTDKILASKLMLIVIGEIWGDVRFKEGDDTGRLRLDNENDWVRKEICTAVAMGNDKIKIIVVKVGEAKLPKTKWNCELDELENRQHIQLRYKGDFKGDFENLCKGIESLVPVLKEKIIEAKKVPDTESRNPENGKGKIKQYIEAERRRYDLIQLPLVSPNGQPVIAALNALRIDLPLVISHSHEPGNAARFFIDSLLINEGFRNSHTYAHLQQIETKIASSRREFSLEKELKPGSRFVIIGDPGCGKSTLLQWVAHNYASGSHQEFLLNDKFQNKEKILPTYEWIPVLILCRDFNGQTPPARIEDLFRIKLKIQQFDEDDIEILISSFKELLQQEKIILLIDGLDEIRDSKHRTLFCNLLNSLAITFPKVPVIITSRVVGFQVVKEVLSVNYDHLVVAPLDEAAKSIFVKNWSGFIDWDVSQTGNLIEKVCKSRELAKLTDNIFLLAMVAQIQVLDSTIPGRRIDIYRRAISIMIQRQRYWENPLSVNEITPHLEYLAYNIRKKGLQRFNELEAIQLFQQVRTLIDEKDILEKRSPEDLLNACIDSLGILQIAGVETDSRGLERNMIQFFHQSFQEYFAGQAIKHGYSIAGMSGAAAGLHELLRKMEVHEQEFKLVNNFIVSEPVLVDYWQEAVRFAISDLNTDEASDAIQMLLPNVDTPAVEVRPRAIFALFCMAEEPKINEQTVMAVFDSVVENFKEYDCHNNSLNSWMDEAIEAISKTSFHKPLGERLITEFIHNFSGQWNCAGGYFSKYWSRNNIRFSSETADEIIVSAKKGLSSKQQTERVRTALELLDYFYNVEGKLSFLDEAQQEELIQSLTDVLFVDKSSQDAAMWALIWLTSATYRTSNSLFLQMMVCLPSAAIIKIEQSLRQAEINGRTLARACLIMTREKDLNLISQQSDWIYDLAVIADGAKPRRALPPFSFVGRCSASVDWMLGLLKLNLPLVNLSRIAISLGSLGIFTTDMIRPLKHMFMSTLESIDMRDEALIYLATIGGSEVSQYLVEAADTAPEEGKDYLYGRGLFGLILMDDIDIIADQMEKDLYHSDLNAYAFCLAGSNKPKAKLILEKFKSHRNPRIQNAVLTALAKNWDA